jgi:aryl-alcohol dehydrogenase-like predicted oxidoreductase
MEKRRLGHSTLDVSVIGLGGNNLGGRIDFAASEAVVGKAIELGINFIDTADAYGDRGGSEEALGRILGARRRDIVLATKFGLPMDDAGTLRGASRRYIMRAIEASLKRLRTDWIDLYYLHRPDPQTPMEETLRALDDLVRAGKVRFIGCSTLSTAQLREARDLSTRLNLPFFVCAQEEYSLLARDVERELVPELKAQGMGLVPYFPLASGLLTGKYKRDAPLPKGSRLEKIPHHAEKYLNARNWRIVEALAGLAECRGRSMLELAIGRLVREPMVASVIAGATKPEQVEANVRAAQTKLTPEALAEIDAITAAQASA